MNVNGAPASYAMGAAIDTGTTFIYVPRAVAAMIVRYFPFILIAPRQHILEEFSG